MTGAVAAGLEAFVDFRLGGKWQLEILGGGGGLGSGASGLGGWGGLAAQYDPPGKPLFVNVGAAAGASTTMYWAVLPEVSVGFVW